MTETEFSPKDELCQKIIDYLEGTKNFLIDECPEVVQQAMRFEKISAICIACLMLVLLVGAIFCFCYFWRHPILDKYESRDFLSSMGMLIPAMASAPLFVTLCYKIEILMKILISPKYFVIDIFKSMVD